LSTALRFAGESSLDGSMGSGHFNPRIDGKKEEGKERKKRRKDRKKKSLRFTPLIKGSISGEKKKVVSEKKGTPNQGSGKVPMGDIGSGEGDRRKKRKSVRLFETERESRSERAFLKERQTKKSP